MKKSLVVLALAALFSPMVAQAEAGDWVVRLRATHITPDESSKLGRMTNAALGAPVLNPGAKLEVESNTIPELDISYYFTKNIAAELILALGSKHDVNIHKNDGKALLPGKYDLGEVNVLPPTLTLQWHFNPDQMIDPYVGAGVNYTRFMDNGLRLDATGMPIRVERNSFGGALQAGVDINLKDGWLLNADIKKLWIDTDVKMNAGAGYVKIDKLDIDPWVISFGFGKKF
jgi:outer membrane protein